jgi:hypothetical protein
MMNDEAQTNAFNSSFIVPTSSLTSQASLLATGYARSYNRAQSINFTPL